MSPEQEYKAMLENLTSTQARCTELLEETRTLKRKLANAEQESECAENMRDASDQALWYLESRVKDYPVLKVLLKQARQPAALTEVAGVDQATLDSWAERARKEGPFSPLEPVVWADEASPFTGSQVKTLLEENERLLKVDEAARRVLIRWDGPGTSPMILLRDALRRNTEGTGDTPQLQTEGVLARTSESAEIIGPPDSDCDHWRWANAPGLGPICQDCGDECDPPINIRPMTTDECVRHNERRRTAKP
jgi:uncharacterized protein YdcH (DUF465 family)